MVKKSGNVSDEQLWFTANGSEDGKPLIFRGRQHVPPGVTEADYPTRVRIHWPYRSVDESGMPDIESNDGQIDLEDALNGLDMPGMSFQMLVVTGNGRKDWYWYVADIEVWMARLNVSLAGKPEFPVEIENSHEPDWSLYHNFISGVRGMA